MAALVGELCAGAALGTALSEGLNMIKKAVRFRSELKSFKDNLDTIEEIVKEGDKLLNHPPEDEMRALISFLKDGQEFVNKCPKDKFWDKVKFWKTWKYAKKLKSLDDKRRMFCEIDVQTNTVRIIASQTNLLKNTERIMVSQTDLLTNTEMILARVEGLEINSITRAGGFSGSCGVPALPEFVIGLDETCAKLKDSLLYGDKKVLVITGPVGCGKTTLAKLLCHEIKDDFENILYVTVSRQSSLKTIAGNLCEHYGMNHREFQDDDVAKKYIENLFKGPGKQLLVLDDVCDVSGSLLVRDLNFQIQEFKILVTSRFKFKSFGSPYELDLLNNEDAKTLFCHYASSGGTLITDDDDVDDLVERIVCSCNGLPLALKVVGASLCGQPESIWFANFDRSTEGSFLQAHKPLLVWLKNSIEALDDSHKECFLDLGVFPGCDSIAGTLLENMWLELYGLYNEGTRLYQLSFRNLVTLKPIRKYVSKFEGDFSEYYVTRHKYLHELAIHLSSEESLLEKRNRLFMEIDGDEVPEWWKLKTKQPINARILSISTGKRFSPKWFDLNAPNVEVLILKIRSGTYYLPEFIASMSKLKVLIVIGSGCSLTELENFEILRLLSKLTTVSFEHVIVSPSIEVIFTLCNLKKLRLVRCRIGDALESVSINLPSLTDLEMDCCCDLKKVPTGLCNILSLHKLSITNCHMLTDLPDELGNLSNVKTLSLHGCVRLHKLPKSIGSMHHLSLIDIYDCLHIKVLPEQIGEIRGLDVLNMRGCSGLQDLPQSFSNFWHLAVICNEEMSRLWKRFQNVKIHVLKEDIFGSSGNLTRSYLMSKCTVCCYNLTGLLPFHLPFLN